MISQKQLGLSLSSLLLVLLFSLQYSEAKRLPIIYWNSSNPIFDVSNTDHVIGAEIEDRVSIHCPAPAPSEQFEYSNIYMVSEDEYNHCVLLNPHFIGSCHNETKKDFSIQLVFRQVSPVPGGLEFVPGQTYYMITTSSGKLDGISNKKGGLCEKKQMKIKFEILTKRDVNPKFAARTLTRDEASTTPVMYIIHNEEENDDDASTSLTLPGSLLIAMIFYYLF